MAQDRCASYSTWSYEMGSFHAMLTEIRESGYSVACPPWGGPGYLLVVDKSDKTAIVQIIQDLGHTVKSGWLSNKIYVTLN